MFIIYFQSINIDTYILVLERIFYVGRHIAHH